MKNHKKIKCLRKIKQFEKKKVDIVCQVGDLTEGMSNRPGHIYELSHLGYHEQKKVAIEALEAQKACLLKAKM